MPPTLAPSTQNVGLGAGELWIDRYDANGVETGLIHVGNCSNVSLAITSEKLVMKNYQVAVRANYAEAPLETAVDIKVTGFEITVANMGMFLMGTVGRTAQAGATVTGEALTPADGVVLGRTYKTNQRSISAVSVKMGATVLEAYDPIDGTGDYKVLDAPMGLIQILETPATGTLVAGSDLTVDYTSAPLTGATALDYIDGATNATITGKLIFISRNVVGNDWDYEFYNVSLTPDGELALIGEDWLQFNLAGSALSDAAGAHGGSAGSPYFRKHFRAA